MYAACKQTNRLIIYGERGEKNKKIAAVLDGVGERIAFSPEDLSVQPHLESSGR